MNKKYNIGDKEYELLGKYTVYEVEGTLMLVKPGKVHIYAKRIKKPEGLEAK